MDDIEGEMLQTLEQQNLGNLPLESDVRMMLREQYKRFLQETEKRVNRKPNESETDAEHVDRAIYDWIKAAEILHRHRYPYYKSGHNVFGIPEGTNMKFIQDQINL